MAFDWYTVPAFGGGLNFTAHPAFIRDDQWSWGDGWTAKYGAAQMTPYYQQLRGGFPPSTLGNLDFVPTGLFQNPFDPSTCILTAVAFPHGDCAMWTIAADGTATEIMSAGAVNASGMLLIGNPTMPANAAMLNGYLCITFGAPDAVTAFSSMIRWNGGGTYQVLDPFGASTGFTASFLRGFAGHLIAARTDATPAGARTILISDANSEAIWTVDSSTSADSAVLDDTTYGISGMELLDNNLLGLFTRSGTHVLSSTGGIPPFVRQYVGGQGCFDDIGYLNYSGAVALSAGYYTTTPYGTAFRGMDNFYLYGTGPFGDPVWPYYDALAASVLDQTPIAGFVWHPKRSILGVPLIEGTFTHSVLWYDPTAQAWSRQTLPGGQWMVQAFLWLRGGTGQHLLGQHWVVSRTGAILVEQSGVNPAAFVDTKDFAFDSPAVGDYVDRIKVEWEPLRTTNLQVWTSIRDHLADGWVGSEGYETAQVPFTLAGELAPGESELPIRLRGKYARFRFMTTTGSARVRGFAIRRQRASDRRE